MPLLKTNDFAIQTSPTAKVGLSGWVEVDETLVGGLEEGVSGRQTAKKTWVIIAAQADGPGTGRIRMQVIKDCSAANLHPFVG